MVITMFSNVMFQTIVFIKYDISENLSFQVHLGDDACAHLRVYKPLPGQGEPQLHSHQTSKTKDHDIEYF